MGLTTQKSDAVLLVYDNPEVGAQLAGLLAGETRHCDLVDGPEAARQRLKSGGYELLVCRESLEGFALLGEIRQEQPLFPAVIVTAAPSLDGAMNAMRLKVTGYLIEPLDVGELVASVEQALERSRSNRAVQDLRQRIEAWGKALHALERSLEPGPQPDAMVSHETLMQHTAGNIMGALLDMAPLRPSEGSADTNWAAVMPPGLTSADYRAALLETVEVLERTKHSFRSRELGQLRKRLQKCLNGETLKS